MTEGDVETDKPLGPEFILRLTASKFRILDKAADKALTQRNADEHRRILRERAELITELPGQIGQAIEKGVSFPENELNNIHEFAELAKQALGDEGTFSKNALLTTRGQLASEPNMLEELIDRVYPPKRAK